VDIAFSADLREAAVTSNAAHKLFENVNESVISGSSYGCPLGNAAHKVVGIVKRFCFQRTFVIAAGVLSQVWCLTDGRSANGTIKIAFPKRQSRRFVHGPGGAGTLASLGMLHLHNLDPR